MKRHLARHALRAGFWIGLAFGLAASVYFQIQPRLSAGATSVFTGAPLGLDEWVYFALARAVLRSPTGLTYGYPFALFWEAPPVLVQLPIALAAWIGRVTGLPIAFEILRVLGTAFSGGCLAIMGACLFRHRGWRAWFYVAAALGGAWFWVLAVVEAIGTAGVYGLTELPTYLQRAMGPIYWWLPFLAQNVWLPLEAVYHALVLGALALLLCGRRRAAAWLGLATWFSNPFPAVSLYAVALPWLLVESLWGPPDERPRTMRTFGLWLITAALGYGYYAAFLPIWPVLGELGRMHQVALAPPPTLAQLVAWFAPLVPAVAWAAGTRRGRRRIGSHPEWRLMAILLLSQLGFLAQFAVAGHHAVQPYHFNRGYLAIASAAFIVRWLQSVAPRRPTRLAALFLLSLCIDQSFFFINLVTEGIHTGFVTREIEVIAQELRHREPGQVVLSQVYRCSIYFAATTDQIPYLMPETMVVPWEKERAALLDRTIAEKGGAGLAELGISLAILQHDNPLTASLAATGWRHLLHTENYDLLELPKEKRQQIPHLPPPYK